MNQKRQYKTYTKAFKEEAVALVIEQGYTVPDAAQSLEIRPEWHLNKSIYYKKQLVNGDKYEATYKKDSDSSRMFLPQK